MPEIEVAHVVVQHDVVSSDSQQISVGENGPITVQIEDVGASGPEGPVGPQGIQGIKGDKGDGVPSGGFTTLVTNLASDPTGKFVGPASNITPQTFGYNNGRWFGGGGGAGTYATMTGTTPLSNVNTYARKTWTVAGTSNGDTGIAHGSGTPKVAVEGETYTVSSYMRANSTPKAGLITIIFNDGTRISSPLVPLPPYEWVKVEHTFTVPAGKNTWAPCSDIVALGNLWAVGHSLDVTGLMVVQLPHSIDYFDGDSPGASWGGVAHKSVSHLQFARQSELGQLSMSGNASAFIKNLHEDPVAGPNTKWSMSPGNGGTGTGTRFASGGPKDISFYQAKWTTQPTSGAARIRMTPDFSVSPSKKYHLSFDAWGTANAPLRVYADYITNLDAWISVVVSPVFQISSDRNNPTRLALVLENIPANAARVKLFASYDGHPPAGTEFNVTNVQVTEGSERFDKFTGDTPGAKWNDNSPHNSQSSLLIPRRSDIETIAASKVRYFEGSGFPEGVVSAPVGSRYIDTNVTNGAVEWIKYAGTGNTGWRVSNGDTGWRNITTSLINGWTATNGSLMINRVGSIVFVRIEQLGAQSSTGDIFSIPPAGFKPYNAIRNFVGSDDASQMRGLYVISSGMHILARSTTHNYRGSISYPTLEAWPSVLPGTPA